MELKTKTALQQLSQYIRSVIDAKNSLEPLKPAYYHSSIWRITGFQYTETGVKFDSAHGIPEFKPSWESIAWEFQTSIKQSQEYQSCLISLNDDKTIIKCDALEQYLTQFVVTIVRKCLQNIQKSNIDFKNEIIIFNKDLMDEPLIYGAEIELVGVIVNTDEILILDYCSIRAIKQEDIEIEIFDRSMSFNSFNSFISKPSAILKIEFQRGSTNQIQNSVEQAIAILRLFKVGSVSYLRYKMYSESIIDISSRGTLSTGDKNVPSEYYILGVSDISRIRKFWGDMIDNMPKGFYDISFTKIESTTIAYQRYCDAMKDDGIFERRIANIIMGLEALYFKPEGELQELAYRLRIRISKVLGIVGFDPHSVKDIINDAYSIRSKYLHGGHLNYKEKTKLEKEYGNLKNLLIPLLNYLRISIIIMIFNHREKEEFIDIVDGSLIDKKKEDQLRSILSSVQEYIIL